MEGRAAAGPTCCMYDVVRQLLPNRRSRDWYLSIYSSACLVQKHLLDDSFFSLSLSFYPSRIISDGWVTRLLWFIIATEASFTERDGRDVLFKSRYKASLSKPTQLEP